MIFRRRLSPLLTLFLFSAVLSLSAAPAAPDVPGPKGGRARPSFVPGEILVQFREGVSESGARSASSRRGTPLLNSYRAGPGGKALLQVLGTGRHASVEEAIRQYEGDPSVAHVQPNYIYDLQAVPNDPSFPQLWGLNNTGQTVNGVAGVADADIDAPEAWDIATGSTSVVVAVLDSGVDTGHPDIQDNLWLNTGEFVDGLDNDGNGFVDDRFGWDFFDNDNDVTDYNAHGSHVAGILGARGDNGAGVAGLNWRTRIMPLKITGVSGFATTAAQVAAINYAVAKGAKVINASWGGPNFDALLFLAIQNAGEQGVLFVAAAGNNGTNNDSIPYYPASFSLSNIITVAATNQSDALASFSNRGVSSVDVAAPGVNIYSSTPTVTENSPVTIQTVNFDSTSAGSVPAGWTRFNASGDLWTVRNVFSASAPNSLEDSPGGNYANDQDSYIWFDTLLRSKDSSYEVSSQVKANLENGFDYFYVASSIDKTEGDSFLFGVTGNFGGFIPLNVKNRLLDGDVEMGLFVGFNVFSDEIINADGVYVDNVVFKRYPLSVSSHGYRFEEGTSMAAPYVSGLAALLYAMLPNAPTSVIKQLIMNGVDAKAGLSAHVASGGRINAFKSAQQAQALVVSAPVLGAFNAHSSSVTWNWVDVSSETGYRVRRVFDDADVSGILPPNTTSWTQTGLPPNAPQQAYVEAVGAYNTARSSNTAVAYTRANPPAGTSVSAITFSGVTIAWSANGNPAGTSYRAEISTDNAVFTEFSSSTALSALAPGLTDFTTYYFRVRAQGVSGVPSAYGAVISTRTPEIPPLPPSGLGVSGRTTSGISWSWADNAGNESGFRVRRLSDGASLSGDLPPGTTSWSQSGMGPNEGSQVYVEAFRSVTQSSSAPTAVAYTFANPPTGTAISTVAFTSVGLSWASAGNPAGTLYKVESSSDNALFSQAASGTALSASVAGLLDYTTYFFRVQAVNGNGMITAPDAVVSARTLQIPPIAPSELQASSRSTGSLTWSWIDGATNETGYRVRRSSDAADLSGALPPGTQGWVQSGLGLNSGQRVYVEAFREASASRSVDSALSHTLVNQPSGTAVTGAFVSSVTLSWSINGNPGDTVYEAQRSMDGAVFESFFSGTGAAGTGFLLPGATYFFRVRASNGDGIATSFDAVVSTATEEFILSASGGSLPFDFGRPGQLLLPADAVLGGVPLTFGLSPVFPPPNSPVLRFSGTGVGVDLSPSNGVSLSRPAHLTLSYSDADVAGLSESGLVLARYVPERSIWVRVPSAVDPLNNAVSADIDAFSLFQVMQLVPSSVVETVKAYPNPVRPGRPGHDALSFTELSPGAKVTVFTMSGDRVAELSADALGTASWNLRNAAGAEVVSGFYLVRVEGAGGAKTINVAVQW